MAQSNLRFRVVWAFHYRATCRPQSSRLASRRYAKLGLYTFTWESRPASVDDTSMEASQTGERIGLIG